jgi:GDP-4-dehydro-6-deoxy-D-mannose reductase
MRALITGISGFVGSHLAEHLLANTDWEVAGTVYGPDQNIRHLTGQLELYPADLSHLPVAESVLEQARPDTIWLPSPSQPSPFAIPGAPWPRTSGCR